MRDPRPISERHIHLAVADALRFFAAPGVVYWHTANERRCTPAEGAFLKRIGVRAGVADFIIIIPECLSTAFGPAICFLELKTTKGRLSPEQKLFRDDVETAGCKYAMPRSVDEALTQLQEWGALHGANFIPRSEAKRKAA